MTPRLNDLTSLPVLRTLLREHGAALLLLAAALIDHHAGHSLGLSGKERLKLAKEAGGLVSRTAHALTPTERLALCGSDAPIAAAAFLGERLPFALADVLTAIGGPASESYYLDAFAAVHGHGLTCHAVGATPDWLDFFSHSLKHPNTPTT